VGEEKTLIECGYKRGRRPETMNPEKNIDVGKKRRKGIPGGESFSSEEEGSMIIPASKPSSYGKGTEGHNSIAWREGGDCWSAKGKQEGEGGALQIFTNSSEKGNDLGTEEVNRERPSRRQQFEGSTRGFSLPGQRRGR